MVLTLPFPRTQRLVERMAVGAVALPLIAVAPVLAIAFSGNVPGIILAAQAVVSPPSSPRPSACTPSTVPRSR